MELRHLRYFMAVVEERSISAAAARLFMTQPALSRQLRQLERELGTRLVERSNRGVEATQEGARLLPTARSIVEQADEAQAIARTRARATTTPSKTLRLGIMDEGAAELTEPILDEFRRQCPGATIKTASLTYDEAQRPERRPDLDAFLVLGEKHEDDATVLFEVDRVILLPDWHPLAGADVLGVEDVLEQPFLTWPTTNAEWLSWWHLDEYRNGERARTREYDIRVMPDVLRAVADGAITTVTSNAMRFVHHPRVVETPLRDVSRARCSLIVPQVKQSGLTSILQEAAALVAHRSLGLVPGARGAPQQCA